MSLIKLDNVAKYYKSAQGVSVGMRNISLDFNLGEFVVVTGESGSGKSTLLNVVSGLDSYEEGEMLINNEETSHFMNKDWEDYRANYIGFIFQNYNIIDSYTVYENVVLALEIQNYSRKLRKKRALELIERVGLLSHKNHKAAKLSGGEKQRVAIARALAKDTPIIVADEPTGNLDSKSSEQVIELLNELSKEKLVILVTHDYDLVSKYATRRVKLHDGEVVEDKQIKKTEIYETPDLKPQKLGFGSTLLFAIRNILSMPKRFLFFIALEISIILIFTLVYTSMIASENFLDPGFGIGWNQNTFDFHTNQTSDNRLFIMKKDGTSLTATDYSALDSLNGNYYLYKDLTFIDSNEFNEISGPNNYYHSYKLDSTYSIMNNPQFLMEGTMNLSNNLNEVIVSNNFSESLNIDDQLTIFYNEYNDRTITATKESEDSYTWTSLPYDTNAILLITMNNNEVVTRQGYSPFNPSNNGISNSDVQSIQVIITSYQNMNKTVTVKGIYNDNYRNTIYFSHDALIKDTIGDTFMLTGINSIHAKRAFDQIDKGQYRVIYPIETTSAIENFLSPINFIFSLLSYLFIFGMGLFLYFLLYTVMRNVMNARKKDFAIFRSIGANQSKLGWLVIFEQLIMMVVSFVISLIVIRIISRFDYSFNLMISRLETFDYILLFLTFTYLSVWLARRFNKKTFQFSIIENITESKEAN